MEGQEPECRPASGSRCHAAFAGWSRSARPDLHGCALKPCTASPAADSWVGRHRHRVCLPTCEKALGNAWRWLFRGSPKSPPRGLLKDVVAALFDSADVSCRTWGCQGASLKPVHWLVVSGTFVASLLGCCRCSTVSRCPVALSCSGDALTSPRGICSALNEDQPHGRCWEYGVNAGTRLIMGIAVKAARKAAPKVDVAKLGGQVNIGAAGMAAQRASIPQGLIPAACLSVGVG